MSFPSITNAREFFSDHYLDSVIAADLKELRTRWDQQEKRGERTARSGIRQMSTSYFSARGRVKEADSSRRHAKAVKAMNDVVLSALGFRPQRHDVEFARLGDDTTTVPVAHDTANGESAVVADRLIALDASFATDVDQVFASSGDKTTSAGGGPVPQTIATGITREVDLGS